MDVYVTETRLHGNLWLYQVWVDGQPYDTFHSTKWLTWAEQNDVAAGYRSALHGYQPATLAAA